MVAARLGLGKQSWVLPAAPSSSCISILEEWCQAAQAKLHWDPHQTLGLQVNGQPADAALGMARSSSITPRTDCKHQLAILLQKRLCRPVIPGDVEYVLEQRESLWTCNVYLHCFSSEASPSVCFTGRPASAKKEAEQSAASEALSKLHATIGLLEVADNRLDGKSELCKLLQKLLGRPLGSEDVVWAYTLYQSLFVASVAVPACSLAATRGSACKTKKEAEQSAAQAALNLLRERGQTKPQGAPRKREPFVLEQVVKSKPPPSSMAGRDDKSELYVTMQMLLGRSLTSDDVLWSCSWNEGLFIACIEVPACGLYATQGVGCTTKKAAEQSAARKALTTLRQPGGVRATSSGEGVRPEHFRPSLIKEDPETSLTCRTHYYFEVAVSYHQQLLVHVRGQELPDEQLAKQAAAWQACQALSNARVKSTDMHAATYKATVALRPGDLWEILPTAGRSQAHEELAVRPQVVLEQQPATLMPDCPPATAQLPSVLLPPPPPAPPPQEPPRADAKVFRYKESLRELRIFSPSEERLRQAWLRELDNRACAWLSKVPAHAWTGDEERF